MRPQIGIRELRQQASAVIRRAAAGEAVEITDRGRPLAAIVPLSSGVLDQLAREGRAQPAGADLHDVLETLGLPRPGGASAADAVVELRADER